MPRPGLALILFGMALGPQGLGVLTTPVLASLDPAVSVSLAALGVLIGLDVELRPFREGRLLGVASLEAGITMLVVAGGLLALHALVPAVVAVSLPLAIALGLCAAPSSTSVTASQEPGDAIAARIGDLDDLLPIVLAAGVVWTRFGDPGKVASLVVQSALIAAAIALAAWLLISQAASESEQRVFSIGALLLLGGAAAHLALPALAAALAAGLFWKAAGGPAADHIVRDMRYLQHPLVVLLLVVAGARLEISTNLWEMVAAYIVLRLFGKLVGARVARRLAPELPRELGWSLTAPGVVAVALALDLLQAQGGSVAAMAMFAVVIEGSLGSELLSWLGAGQASR
jgi:hypothetical protein